MTGLRKQTADADEQQQQQQQQPPVVSASTAWRAYPPTADVRAARGVDGRYTSGSGSSAAVEWEEPSVDEVEAEFWRIVEAAEEQVEALYGQDIDTATYCSAFPTIRVSCVCGRGMGQGCNAGMGGAAESRLRLCMGGTLQHSDGLHSLV
jgi:hypothetical protein